MENWFSDWKCVNSTDKQPILDGKLKGNLVRDGSNPNGWPLPIVCKCLHILELFNFWNSQTYESFNGTFILFYALIITRTKVLIIIRNPHYYQKDSYIYEKFSLLWEVVIIMKRSCYYKKVSHCFEKFSFLWDRELSLLWEVLLITRKLLLDIIRILHNNENL